MKYPKPILDLLSSYLKLPGIGNKTALRLVFHTIDMKEKDLEEFANALINLKNNLVRCKICNMINEDEECEICKDNSRDISTICVVENDKDLIALENMGRYNGIYHVLGGVISPMDGIGPNDIKIKELLVRLKDNNIKEVILATNSSPEGEGTATFISKILKSVDIKVTRIAQGISFGSGVEYADEVTLSRALSGRIEL